MPEIQMTCVEKPLLTINPLFICGHFNQPLFPTPAVSIKNNRKTTPERTHINPCGSTHPIRIRELRA